MDDEPAIPPPTVSRWREVAEGIHDALAGKIDQRKTAQVTGMLEQFEADLGPVIAPIAQKALTGEVTVADLETLIGLLGQPEHFGESVVIGIAIGAIVGPVLGAALAPVVQGLANTAWNTAVSGGSAFGAVPLTPDLLASSVLKGVLTEAQAAAIAANSGTDATAFSTMVQTAGQAIGLAEALLLLRRNQIDTTQFQAVEQYSNLNPKFYGMAELLKYAPPGAGEVLAGAIKGHLTDADATTKLGEAGIDPANYAWMKATTGRPPGAQEMLNLMNRGQMTQAQVVAGLQQSDLNDTYIPFVLDFAVQYPPARSAVPMLKAGAITEAQLRQLLGYHGYPTWIQDAFVLEATKPKNATVHELAVAQIVRGYELGLIPQAEALTRIEAHGFNATDAQLYLTIADTQREETQRNAAMNRIRNRYVAYKITQTEAQADLARLGLPANVVTTFMGIWNNDRAANTAVLTVGQIQQGYHRGVLTLDQFITEAKARGYAGIEIKVLAAEAWPPTKVPAAVMALDPATL